MAASKKGVRQFPPVSSNMLDEGGAGGEGDKKKGMSGVFICDVRVHHNYSQNIDRNGRMEFRDAGTLILRGCCRLNSVWNTANF